MPGAQLPTITSWSSWKCAGWQALFRTTSNSLASFWDPRNDELPVACCLSRVQLHRVDGGDGASWHRHARPGDLLLELPGDLDRRVHPGPGPARRHQPHRSDAG